MKLKLLIGVLVLVALVASVKFSKNKRHSFALTFSWYGNRPELVFNHGTAWVASWTGQDGFDEMFARMAQEYPKYHPEYPIGKKK